jgi:hypothetical protein
MAPVHVCKGRVHETWLVFIAKASKIIWVELYYGIIDMLKAGEACASNIGRLVVMPRNFNGGECDVQAQFLDAMTLV